MKMNKHQKFLKKSKVLHDEFYRKHKIIDDKHYEDYMILEKWLDGEIGILQDKYFPKKLK